MGHNFFDSLFASKDYENLGKRDLLEERNKFFPLKVDPVENGCKNENQKVAAPESVPSAHFPTFKGIWVHPMFPTIFTKGNYFCDFLFSFPG